ncbi:DUF3809 family protein [Meiothermus taiwanensis]|jgi:hypothetical protein|uniref:DUF3809 domain-containing protein n=1 Tax=Meiothermus taiwanensis WR-220 TaxID=1339250 RepID=A0ABM6WK54_9DEIN|nr:DUF3809 family protein [Meiothermus taiwanensis]AWR87382.1 hypothetical protein Mtai_v1c21500 [Meiothermus taiwanensis WR-220]KIQ55976.1 hypothetical protein SY28_00925 [Meiothermus taiwanensis]KZK15725.1 hypothetical protein A3962_01440 [Meiothermus taiwanensis]
MILEKTFQLKLPEPPEHLLQPERVFGGRPPFSELTRQGTTLQGYLVAEAPLFGEIQFPFQSRIHPQGLAARLEALPLPEPPAFWAELEGHGEVVEGGIAYQLTLRIHATLPQGEKWGGRALGRLAEAAFERNVERVLQRLTQA